MLPCKEIYERSKNSLNDFEGRCYLADYWLFNTSAGFCLAGFTKMLVIVPDQTRH